jgi:hypothetical protein
MPSPRARRPLAAGLLTALLLAPQAPAPAAAGGAGTAAPYYTTTFTRMNRVGLTVTNYGFFGNNFVSRSPSFEFPLGTGYEHMARGGLWVGAVAIADTGLFIGVSSGVVDNSQGSGGVSETEFTPDWDHFTRRSRIQNDAEYSPAAVADEELLTVWRDTPAKPAAGYQSERHSPLGIEVRQRVLSFSLDAADAFAAVRFTVVNHGPPLQGAWVALYTQLVSGPKNAYGGWPPTATNGPGSWYYNTYADYLPADRLYRERYCRALPMPAGCFTSYCPPWAGVKLLGAQPGGLDTRPAVFNWWTYSPGDTTRGHDRQRYALMNTSSSPDPRTCVPGAGCSPIALLSAGPFAAIATEDSVVVDFAFVGGDDEASLIAHARYAQFAYDIGYQLPAPPPSPRLHVVTGDHRIDVYWDDSPEFASDPTSPMPGGRDFEGYRVYLSEDRQDLHRVAQYDLVDTTGYNTGMDRIALGDGAFEIGGVTYRYHQRIEGLRDGFSYWGSVTAYDIGDLQMSSLESGIGQNKFLAIPNPAPGERSADVAVFPNPYRVEARWDQGTLVRDHYLWFINLPRRCDLRIYTLSGDLVYATRFDGDSYDATNARGVYDPHADLDTGPPALSGASFAWDLITQHGQAAASGLYLFSVHDLDGGRTQQGKFLVVKSDRE